MPESERHRRLKECLAEAAGGETECEVPSGRLDACSPYLAAEVELSNRLERLIDVALKLGEDPRPLRWMVVPEATVEDARMIADVVEELCEDEGAPCPIDVVAVEELEAGLCPDVKILEEDEVA